MVALSRERQLALAAPTSVLAAFAANLEHDAVPAVVRERVKEIILDAVASALAGHDASEVSRVLSFAKSLSVGRDATVIGGGHLSLAGATMANAYLITAVTVCDIHRPTHCHVTPEVVAPALVMAEHRRTTGRELLVAVAAGLEVTTRVGLGLKPEVFRSRGWHSPGITGPFGGAAAVARLLRLTPEGLENALGIAGSQASGSYAQLRTPTIKLQQAHGALSGLVSAKLAATGFRAAHEILLHRDGGLFRTHSDGGDAEATIDGLGESWELQRISLRAWPVAVHLQPLVTSLLDLVIGQDLHPTDVATVKVDVSNSAYAMHGTTSWEDRFKARLSIPYVTGVVIHDRKCWLDQFSQDRVLDTALGDFVRQRVTVTPSDAVQDGTCRVEIATQDGRVFQDFRLMAKGEPADPLSRAEIVEKFRLSADGRLSAANAERVVTFVTELEDVQDVAELTNCLSLNEE